MMLERNTEIRREGLVFFCLSAVLTGVGFRLGSAFGWLTLAGCVILTAAHFVIACLRCRNLQKLTLDIDRLLHDGTPVPIRDYSEGELSILTNQIQKMTLRLTEAAETSLADKRFLADSMADISHQLRTPLTAMNLTASMLSAPDLTDSKRLELARELRNLLSRTEWLVETLLKISKLDAGTVEMASDMVSIGELVSRAAGPLVIPMELREQKLVVSCGDSRFRGDLTWTAEALGNILKNSMEHTPNGGSITVHAQENALYTEITVEDTGSGFPSADIPRLFERFYKGSNASENSYGIGLSLARTVITAQNGTVQAMNGSTGAKFVIKFYKQVI